ncbi:DMT family transporter [Tropicibacter sp. R16_0]|uniref:DMT family transporter n=1 Tax=Tropicibacter sp. R16_0 TaxID=2821102 RepID=UPI001ADBEF93|nr:DMT family transporter [Tropicibacter sp. R16_0]MBO9450419.1 DMT family transporter [Tropicibacter sp. R16_0]
MADNTTAPLEATTRKDNLILAVALSLLALVLFDAMGLIIKYLSPRYAAAELSAYRNFFGIFPSVIALWSSRAWHQSGRPLKMRQWKLGLMRGVFVTFAQFLYYFSLGKLAFATATTITYTNAFFLTALAVPILGEKVGWARWSAVLIGFSGVIWIMKPGSDSFTVNAIAPVGAAFLYAIAGVTARLFDPEVPSPLINLYSVVSALVGSLVLVAVVGGFSPIERAQDFFWVIGIGMFGGTAVLCLVVSYRMTEQSNLAPFSYFGIPIAFVAGWLVFDEAPWGDLFPGALLIVVGGLLVVWRERRLKR